ncbi:MAG: hypothetical protein ACYSUI_20265 [Planctomycetota bacterium]|jgi:hypothetical protein
MKTRSCPHAKTNEGDQHAQIGSPRQGFLRRWFLCNTLIAGVLAL